MQLISKPDIHQSGKTKQILPQTLICFSHLRWDFVFQRPQHLLNRMAKKMEVFYIEEPMADATDASYYVREKRGKNLTIMVPHIEPNQSASQIIYALEQLFNDFMADRVLSEIAFWYYTPMALLFTHNFEPALIIFDCMDELSAFKFAPEEIKTLEKELLKKADIVFTGGQSLYEAKKSQHSNIHAFPSSIEKAHFAKARTTKMSPPDQPQNNLIKLGFYGVIDERFDIELIRGIAHARPDWQIILIGPVVKIDPASLPRFENIFYLGSKTYEELPKYINNWDIALIPFLLNESTRFISPTKTPEYLAAGVPVISTPIKDVINPYGKNKLVSIANTSDDFIAIVEKDLQHFDKKEWLQRVDFFLSNNSWDITCERMLQQISDSFNDKAAHITALAQ